MATITADPGAIPAQAAVAVGNRRLSGLRSLMLTLISAALAYGVLAGIVAWQANATTYSAYHTMVDEDSVSVDAALKARAAALDHMSASATYLETTGTAQKDASALAQRSWAAFSNESRISWRNLTDRVHGEYNVYAAADRAASDYIQQIGAMYAYYGANQTAQAGTAFLQARETLNTLLVPALGGLESVKVEDMEATYAGANDQITRWRYALLGVAALLALMLVAGLWSVRRMHYRWSWTIGGALVLVVGLALLMQTQLAQASSDARVMVREAYDSVAAVQDLEALLSQGRALESIVVFDPKNAAQHLASFDQYDTLVEQNLCGPRDCTASTFLSGPDTIAPAVQKAALDEQSKLGLPRTPLVANIHFANQAARFEELRVAYRKWIDEHNRLANAVTGGQIQEAANISTGTAASAFTGVVNSAGAANQVARDEYDKIWKGVYNTSSINQVLALIFPACGLLAASGLWRRRSELYG
jgi:hypothetical protein